MFWISVGFQISIGRLFMKGKFNAYLLRLLEKMSKVISVGPTFIRNRRVDSNTYVKKSCLFELHFWVHASTCIKVPVHTTYYNVESDMRYQLCMLSVKRKRSPQLAVLGTQSRYNKKCFSQIFYMDFQCWAIWVARAVRGKNN